MTQTFRIDGTLPGLNNYTKACRAGHHAGAAMKRRAEEVIVGCIRLAGLKPIAGQVTIHYTWIEPNKRRDLDNVCFARKFVQDALVTAGVLAGDGPKYIRGFSDEFMYDKEQPGVVVTVTDEEENVNDAD